MNSVKHLRLLGLFASAAAIAAFGVPSTALAGKSHHLSPYKVEDHVELEGEDSGYTLACKNDDLAVDGMWRVDNVDQDNDWEDPNSGLAAFWAWPASTSTIGTSADLTIRKAVRPMGAYASSSDQSLYHFEFTPLGGADVQIKLWVICLPQPVTGFGHTHTWEFTDTTYHTQTVTPAAPGDDPAAAGAGDDGYFEATCGPKTVLVNPGFQTANTNHHVVASRPTPSGSSWNGRNWTWRVWDDDGTGGTTEVSWRCMDIKSSAASNGTHTHKVVINKKETTWDSSPAADPQIGPQRMGERQQHCGEHYKALLGGWDVSGTWREEDLVGPKFFPHHMRVYFLGMDPRIKTRAFSFLNLDEDPATVDTAVVCFKDRTT